MGAIGRDTKSLHTTVLCIIMNLEGFAVGRGGHMGRERNAGDRWKRHYKEELRELGTGWIWGAKRSWQDSLWSFMLCKPSMLTDFDRHKNIQWEIEHMEESEWATQGRRGEVGWSQSQACPTWASSSHTARETTGPAVGTDVEERIKCCNRELEGMKNIRFKFPQSWVLRAFSCRKPLQLCLLTTGVRVGCELYWLTTSQSNFIFCAQTPIFLPRKRQNNLNHKTSKKNKPLFY